MASKKIIQERSFRFALEVIALHRKLTDQREYVISRQLLRSGTSIGANVAEAEAAHSRRDFTAKMIIASKEARETKYWLRLLKYSEAWNVEVDQFLSDIDEMIRILTSIIKTMQETDSQ